MNKKISQFDITTEFNDGDVLTLVQNKQNKNISKESLETNLSKTFATNESVKQLDTQISNIDSSCKSRYNQLDSKITQGDNQVRQEYKTADEVQYKTIDSQLDDIKDRHNKDIKDLRNTVQDWADEIDKKALKEQIQIILNRLTIDENLITELSKLIAEGGSGSGGGGSVIPAEHTQPTSTIFPLTGYVKGSNADPLTTTDTLNQALSKLENQIANGSGSGSMLPLIKKGQSTATSDGTLYTSAKVEEDYIRKNNGVATDLRLNGSLQNNGKFTSGFDGQGFQLKDKDGKWRLELDELFVRGALTVSELVLNEIKAVGGDIIVSMADMEISNVVSDATGYICYMDDHDGTKQNEFIVNDLAICQQFDGQNVRRYWRRVIEVGHGIGNTYVKLSKVDCESGSGEPMVGDKLLLLGHKVESDSSYNEQVNDRRSAIFITSKGEGAPRITFYENIDDFTLVNKDRTSIGKDSKFVGTLMQTTETGDVVRIPVYRGVWVSGNTYNYYDQVTYQGQLWICMRNGVTSVPSEDNEDWQLQVAKGEKGASGDDAAKWVEITGDRLFLYGTTDYSDTPTPETITLNVNTYGIDTPTYKWLMNGDAIGTEQSCTISHDSFTTKTVTIRCTVKDANNNEYYDETQLAKLASGADGEDAYYVDLTNGTVNIPYDNSGNTPLVTLNTIYTEVYAYKGIEAIDIAELTASAIYGTATVTVAGNKVSLSTLSSTNTIIRLNIKLSDSTVITKDWYINKTFNGKDGYSGVDAAYVVLVGDMIFKYNKGESIPVNQTITLTASQYQIENPVYTWYYYNISSGKWVELSTGITVSEDKSYSTLTVGYNNSPYFNDSSITLVKFKVMCTSENGGAEYFDEISIIKQYDGKDGLAGYGCLLTNENHTIAATHLGETSKTDLNNTYTETQLWYGTQKLANDAYTITYTTLTGTGTLLLDQSNKKLTLASIANATDMVVFRISFQTDVTQDDGSTKLMEVGTKDFTITKAKGAAKPDTQVTIYAEALNTARPNNPSFTTDPPVASGSESNGTIWYPDADSTHFTYKENYVIWASQSTLSGDTNTFSDWSTPVQWSGQGAAGKDGATPEIINGYWYIDGKQIGKAVGDDGKNGTNGVNGVNGVDGKSPYISNGYWYYWNGSSWVKSIQAQGEKGDMGAGFNFRGNYSSSSTYYYTENQRDVVYYNSRYYMVKTQGSTTATPSTSSSYWETFGGSFESLATGLFLANEATIAGWVFSSNRIRSASSNVLLDGRATGSAPYPIAIGSNAVSSPSSAAFNVSSSGVMSATGATISGTITATSGKIGGLYIGSNVMQNTINAASPTSSNIVSMHLGIHSVTGNNVNQWHVYSDESSYQQYIKNTGNTALKIDTASGGNGVHIAATNGSNGLYVTSTATDGNAIYASGPIKLLPGSYGFTVPGILGIYWVSGLTGTISASRQLGGSATIASVKRTATGVYTVTYTNTGGGTVYPVIVPAEMYSSKPVSAVCVTNHSSTSFTFRSYSTEDNSLNARDFNSGTIILLGKNGTTANA